MTPAHRSTASDFVVSRGRFEASLGGFVHYLRHPGTRRLSGLGAGLRVGRRGVPAHPRHDLVVRLRAVSFKKSWATKRKEHWAEVKRRIVVELLERAVLRRIEEVTAPWSR